MTVERRRTFLFLLCAAVLLAAGYAWGYARAYDGFYSPDASIDRELLSMEFNGRVLHHVNAGQPKECSRELVTQLRRQMIYIGTLVKAASPDARQQGEAAIQQAERAIAGQATDVAVAQPEGAR